MGWVGIGVVGIRVGIRVVGIPVVGIRVVGHPVLLARLGSGAADRREVGGRATHATRRIGRALPFGQTEWSVCAYFADL
ncbi:hypothetical protein GCM10027074_46290 [Streptomyces deserti]